MGQSVSKALLAMPVWHSGCVRAAPDPLAPPASRTLTANRSIEGVSNNFATAGRSGPARLRHPPFPCSALRPGFRPRLSQCALWSSGGWVRRFDLEGGETA